MNSLESILDTWTDDCDIDRTQPGEALINIPKLHAKYLRTLTKYRLLLRKCEEEYATERKLKYNYYNGNLNTDKETLVKLGLEPFKFVLKADLQVYMDADDGLNKIINKKTYYKEIIQACEYIMTELKSRTYNLKSFIDWQKFIQGG